MSFGLNGCQQHASEELPGEKQQDVYVKEVQSNETKAIEVREKVWNQLTNKDKEHIQGTWEDASVKKITLRETMGIIKDKTFIGKEVFVVDYPSNENPTLGGFTIFADIISHKLLDTDIESKLSKILALFYLIGQTKRFSGTRKVLFSLKARLTNNTCLFN